MSDVSVSYQQGWQDGREAMRRELASVQPSPEPVAPNWIAELRRQIASNERVDLGLLDRALASHAPAPAEACRHLNSQTEYRSGIIECDDCGASIHAPAAPSEEHEQLADLRDRIRIEIRDALNTNDDEDIDTLTDVCGERIMEHVRSHLAALRGTSPRPSEERAVQVFADMLDDEIAIAEKQQWDAIDMPTDLPLNDARTLLAALRGASSRPSEERCRFGCDPEKGNPVVALVEFSAGCAAFPDDRRQWVCEHHLNRAEPIEGMTVLFEAVRAGTSPVREERERIAVVAAAIEWRERMADWGANEEESKRRVLREEVQKAEGKLWKALAPFPQPRAPESAPPREGLCMVCHREYPVWYAPNDLWNAFMRRDRLAADEYDFICPTCFANHAVSHGLNDSIFMLSMAERGDRNASTVTYFCVHCKVENAGPGHTCTGIASGIINAGSTEPELENTERASVGYAARVFDLLEHWTPERRARVFYEIETRWCWTCGKPQSDGEHEGCNRTSSPVMRPSNPVAGESERETLAALVLTREDFLTEADWLAYLDRREREALVIRKTREAVARRYTAINGKLYRILRDRHPPEYELVSADEAASLIEQGESEPTDEAGHTLIDYIEILALYARKVPDVSPGRVDTWERAALALTPKGADSGQGGAEP